MDLKNGGILGVLEGAEEAIKEIGWELKVIDANGSKEQALENLQKASSMDLDGVIIGGLNASDFKKELQALAEKNIKIVGWHCAGKPGPISGTPVQANITTDPIKVANYAVRGIINENSQSKGVIIFTDSNFEIALTKSSQMAKSLSRCQNCKLLEVVDLELASTSLQAQEKINQLLQKYGRRWTHSLGINDLYFDYAAPIFAIHPESFPLEIKNISAGDGSYSAYLRIKYDGQQQATIPEPLLFQGWQAVDELNRLFSKQPPSEYIAPIIIITQKNILDEINKNNLFDPSNNYRSAYRRNWNNKR